MKELELANHHYVNKEFDVAKEYYEIVLEQHPDNAMVLHNHGLTCIQLDQNEEAIKSFELPCRAGSDESLISRGVARRNLGMYKEAMHDFAQAFILNPEHATAYSNYGNSLREFSKPNIAVPFMQLAQQFDPTNVNYRLNESICHLMKGDLVEGWKKYDARWWYQSDVSFKPTLPGPEYDGTQDINGNIVVVYYEQGFGDSIQFIRFIRILQDKGATVIIVTKPQLIELFKFNFPELQVVNNDEQLPPYHYHVPLMDLPKCFGTTIDSIPSPTPYLDVDDSMKESWKNRLGEKKKKRIGILWSPNKIAFITRFRRIELEQLLSIVNDEYEFVSLSYEVSEEEEQLLKQHNVKDYREHLNGFYSTAGLISQMDLVISIDTVIPHLSGALGVPTWVMLSDYGCDWRWFIGRDDSPFYNCVRLFRQDNSDWENVLGRIKAELKNLG